MTPEEELAKIQNVFGSFFMRHGFKLKSAGLQEIIFENNYSELLFDFDNFGMRFGYMAPPVIIYIDKASSTRYAIMSLVEHFHEVDFQLLFDDLWKTKGFGYYETWHNMIEEYLEAIISDSSFSWVNEFSLRK